MVLVSHDHNFIFPKTYKTASTSAEMFCEPFCAQPEHEVSISTPARETKHGIIGRRNDADGEVRSGKGIRPPKKLETNWSGRLGPMYKNFDVPNTNLTGLPVRPSGCSGSPGGSAPSE